jgi:hypothetical protein
MFSILYFTKLATLGTGTSAPPRGSTAQTPGSRASNGCPALYGTNVRPAYINASEADVPSRTQFSEGVRDIDRYEETERCN